MSSKKFAKLNKIFSSLVINIFEIVGPGKTFFNSSLLRSKNTTAEKIKIFIENVQQDF